MNKKLVDGMVVSSAALLLTAITSLSVKNTKLAFVGGLLGGVGCAIARQQQSKQITAINNKINYLQQQFNQLQLQQHIVGDRILEAATEQDMLLAAEHNEFVCEKAIIPDDAAAIAWFSSRNITIEKHHQLNAQIVPVFDALALHLGKYYNHLAPLYQQLKRSANSGEQIKLHLQHKNQSDISHFTNFCTLLSKNSFLASYHYVKSEKFLKATVQNRGDIKNFFTGIWFERFIYQVVLQTIAKQGLSYTCLINPHIQFVNENRFELDLFFLIAGEPLWIECKTGKEYNAHLPKYFQLRDKLKIPKERAFLVVLGISEDDAANLTNFWNITVANQDNIAEHIAAVLSRQRLNSSALNCQV